MSATDDVVAQAKAALEGVEHKLPWSVDPDAYYLSDDDGVDNSRYWDVDRRNGGWVAHCEDLPTAQFVAAAPLVVSWLVAEVERLREGLTRIEHFSRVQALSDRVRTGPARETYHCEERYWLDLLAIIERVQAGAK